MIPNEFLSRLNDPLDEMALSPLAGNPCNHISSIHSWAQIMTEQADFAEMTHYKPEMLSSYELGSMEMVDPIPIMAPAVVREPSKSERAMPSAQLDL